jgi:hypothetical protein
VPLPLLTKQPFEVSVAVAMGVDGLWLTGTGAGRLGKTGSVHGRQLSAADASALLTRCLKAFQLGSPLYRNIVVTLAVVGIFLFILGLALAVAHLDYVAKGMLYTLVAVVVVIAITLLCATPSGAATHFFKVCVCPVL